MECTSFGVCQTSNESYKTIIKEEEEEEKDWRKKKKKKEERKENENGNRSYEKTSDIMLLF